MNKDESHFEEVDLASYDNSWYRPGAAWKRVLWYWVNAVFFNSSLFPYYSLKTFLLRAFGAKTGKNVFIKPYVSIKYPWFLETGDNIWIGERVWIDNLATVRLGNNVCLSQGCMLLSGNHDYNKKSFDLVLKDIVVEDGAWIGAGAIVCGGVTCRSHSVLSVGSVAARDLDAWGIYQGNPAAKVKERIIS